MSIIIIVLVVLLAIAITVCIALRDKLKGSELTHANELHEIESSFLKEKQQFQERSRIVNKGLISQEMVPLIPGFPYAFKDARRAVHPLDYIVFDGLSDGNLKEVIFLEIKTGTSDSLTSNERQIRKAVDAGHVRYEIFNPDKQEESSRKALTGSGVSGKMD